ncbi:MAG: DUF547 domain-containing protein [Acidimicrobiia bacterium]
MSAEGPNPLRAGWAILKARRVRRPRPLGNGTVDHEGFRRVLDTLGESGMTGLEGAAPMLDAYRDKLHDVDPDRLSAGDALAFWLNLYNAEALAVATTAARDGALSVFRQPGALRVSNIPIAGEHLSIEDIEHGKIRRFADPRIHAALVCGALSCPTLRYEPYDGEVHHQLDDQMRVFLAGGAATLDRNAGTVSLSRIFKWFGRDFTHPHRMPTLLPSRSRRVVAAVARWLPPEDADWIHSHRPQVRYQPYDFGLGCTVR